ERDLRSIRREADRARRGGRLVEDAPRRELDAPHAFLLPRDREPASVGVEIGLPDAVQDLPRSATPDRHARQHPGVEESSSRLAAYGNRHLAGVRDREEVCSGRAERARFRVARVNPRELDRTAFPCAAEADRLAVRGESRSVGGALVDGDPAVREVTGEGEGGGGGAGVFGVRASGPRGGAAGDEREGEGNIARRSEPIAR